MDGGLPPGDRLVDWSNGEHTFTATRLAPTVFVTRGVGVMTGDVMDRFIAMLDREIAAGTRGMEFFHDWEHIESYEPAMRQKLTEWRRRAPRGATKAINVLVRSKLVAMGVSASAVLLRLMGLEIQLFSSRDEFTRAIHRAISAPR
jgi:hypothetical protein